MASIKVIVDADLSLIVTPTAHYLSPCGNFAHLWNSSEPGNVKSIKFTDNKSFIVKNIDDNIRKYSNLPTLTNQKLKLGFSFDSNNDYALVEIQIG